MEIKFKVLSVNEQTNSFVVQFYTDAMMKKYPGDVAQRLAAQVALQPDVDPAVLESWIMDNYPCGSTISFDFLPGTPAPGTQQFMDFVVSRAPLSWLSMMDAIASGQLPSVSAVRPIVGDENIATVNTSGPLPVVTQVISPIASL